MVKIQDSTLAAVHAQLLSHIQLWVALWTGACQALLFTGVSKREYWNGVPWPPLGDLPHTGIKPASLMSLAWQAGSLPLAPPGKRPVACST